MKILQVNCVYCTGSTGKITYDLHMAFQAKGLESVVCYGRGRIVTEPHVYKVCPEWYSKVNNAISRLTGVMYGGCSLSTNKLIQIIKRENPDVVHLQCINGYFVNIYRLVEWLKATRIRTVLTLHAEFMYTGGCGHSIDCNQWSNREGCGHSINCPRWRAETRSILFDNTFLMWKRMRNAFSGFDELVVVSVSPWLKERAEQSGILSDKYHLVVLNGLDVNVFHSYGDSDKLKQKLGIEGKKVIFHATPLFTDKPGHLKGGRYVLELARKMPEIIFMVAGPYSISGELPTNVKLLGRVDDQTMLARYYSLADITVLTSERETFSMICAESLSCGTPIVGFRAGAPEMISLPEYSRFVEFGDINALKIAATEMIERGKEAEIESKAREKYNRNKMVDSYIEIYHSLLY